MQLLVLKLIYKLPKDLLFLIAKKLDICDRNKLRVLNKRMNENVKKMQKQFGIRFNCCCFLEEKNECFKIGCYQWINNFDRINDYFIYYAKHGWLNALKHFVKLDHYNKDQDNKINIHHRRDYAFRCAAKNGHLHILAPVMNGHLTEYNDHKDVVTYIKENIF